MFTRTKNEIWLDKTESFIVQKLCSGLNFNMMCMEWSLNGTLQSLHFNVD
jgi:hypothetical protein